MMLSAIRTEMKDRHTHIKKCIDHLKWLTSSDISEDIGIIQNTLKSTIILMIYNLIEYIFAEIFDIIYEELVKHEFNSLKPKIQEQISCHFYQYRNDCTDPNKKVQLLKEIISCTNLWKDINKIGYENVAKKLHNKNISWNVQWGVINKFIKRYDIKGLTDFEHDETQALFTEIAKQRNSLVHGEASFTFLVQKMSINDIENKFNAVMQKLKLFLNCIERYLIDKDFLSSDT